MGNVINFRGKPTVTAEDNMEVTIPAGSTLKVIGEVENNILKNEKLLPVVPKEQLENMIDYQKRYTIAEGVDAIFKRVEDDETLADQSIVIVIHPQKITKDEVTGQDRLSSTFELGVLLKAQVQENTKVSLENSTN